MRSELVDELYLTVKDYPVEDQRHIFWLNLSINLAQALMDERRFQEAEERFLAAIPILIKMNGEEDQDTISVRFSLTSCLNQQGKHAEVIRAINVLLPIMRKVIPEDHGAILQMNLFLSYALFQLGQFAQAEESFREVFEMRKSFFGDGAETVIAGKNLMTCLAQLGRYKDAEEVGQVILPMAKAMYGENHIKTHELQSEMNLMASGALGDPALSEEEELAAALSASLNEEETMAMEEMRMIEEAIAASLAEDERRKMAGEVPDSLLKPADWPDIPDEEDDYQTMPEEVD